MICADCVYFNGVRFCKRRRCGTWDKAGVCRDFKEKTKMTNGDVIRQGGNKRLITFSTEWSCFHCAYRNGIESKCESPEGKDCFDGIEAWLNAPAESEVKNV